MYTFIYIFYLRNFLYLKVFLNESTFVKLKSDVLQMKS